MSRRFAASDARLDQRRRIQPDQETLLAEAAFCTVCGHFSVIWVRCNDCGLPVCQQCVARYTVDPPYFLCKLCSVETGRAPA